jgi:Fe-S-cluster-containing dehydrogenase component
VQVSAEEAMTCTTAVADRQPSERDAKERRVTSEHDNDLPPTDAHPAETPAPQQAPVGSQEWGREILDGVDADTELGLAAARDALAVAAGELDEDEFRDRYEVDYLSEFGLDRRPRLADGLTRPATEPAVTGRPPAATSLPPRADEAHGGGCGCDEGSAGDPSDVAPLAGTPLPMATSPAGGGGGCGGDGGCGCGDGPSGPDGPAHGMSRRSFVGAAAGTAGAAVFFAAAMKSGAFAVTGDGDRPTSRQPAHEMRDRQGKVAAGVETDVQMGMVVDLERCDGCMECVSACSESNGLSQGSLWALVMPFQEPENEDPDYLFRVCQHCTRAPCVMVCPTGARHRRLADGLVLTDYDVCIGCRYCEVACPYGVNVFQWADPRMNGGDASGGKRDARGIAVTGEPPRGVMGKCTFCPTKQDDPETRGSVTCANACHMDAIQFGDLNDPKSVPNVYLAKRREEAGGNLPTFRLLDELGTQPNIIYIGHPPSKDAQLVEGAFTVEDWGLTDDRRATLEGPAPWFDRMTGKAEA